MLADRNLACLSSERLHLNLTQVDVETHSQTLDRAWGLMEQLGEAVRALEGIRTPQKDQEIN